MAKIIEIPEKLTYQERLDFLSNKKIEVKERDIDKNHLIGETEYFLVYKKDGIITIESRDNKKYADFSDDEKDDLVDAFDIVKIKTRNHEINYDLNHDLDYYMCIIK